MRPRDALADRRLVNVARAAALALLAIGMLMAGRAELIYRDQAARQVAVQADILAASVSAALTFDDVSAMREYVNALRVNGAVAKAAVYDVSGKAVVVFHRAPAVAPPAQIAPRATTYVARYVMVTRPVAQQGALLGWVYLETRPEPWATVLGRHAALGLLTLLAFVLLGAMAVAAQQLQARALELATANAQLVEEISARGKAEEALRQSQKMEALGQLTGGIAHDFNNLLQVVHGAFELIRRRSDDAQRVLAWADNGMQAAERGASLTRQLLAFSRSQRLELRSFVVADLIIEIRDLLMRTLGPTIELRLVLGDPQAAVLSDRTQLELAVLNLAINARDAMPNGGRLTVGVEAQAIADGDPLLEAGDYVALSVADTGEGMSPQVIERAFDPFFTTKGVGKGTGLGLSQVYGVARQAGGAARIESPPGGGAVITLMLRRSTMSAEGAPARGEGTDLVLAAQPGRTVLVVDDEPQVRALVCETLELLGYRVLTADGGAAALEILEDERPDLMMFDYAMPGMSGAELAGLAHTLHPDTPIVFASGHADTEAIDRALGGRATILRKPFNMAELARTIADLLARPPA